MQEHTRAGPSHAAPSHAAPLRPTAFSVQKDCNGCVRGRGMSDECLTSGQILTASWVRGFGGEFCTCAASDKATKNGADDSKTVLGVIIFHCVRGLHWFF